MQTDIDKTMDAILRRARETGFSDGPAADAHLDADELSLFAENLSPPRTRVHQVEHLANCRSCRSELAQLIQLDADAAEDAMPVSETVAAPAVSDTGPWYRRLMLFPNLAYVMGGLVLVFGGLLAVSVYQSNLTNEVSYSTDKAMPEMPSAANTSSNAGLPADGGGGGGISGDHLEDDLQTANSAADAMTNSNASTSGQTSPKRELKKDDSLAADESAAPTMPTVSGTSPRPYIEQESRDEQAADTVAAAPPAPSGGDEGKKMSANDRMAARSAERSAPKVQALPNKEAESRTVAGRTFTRKQGVWYDPRYNGGPTVNVRRGTSDYGRIAEGVKRIAEQLSGTAVIVGENGKAYRISD